MHAVLVVAHGLTKSIPSCLGFELTTSRSLTGYYSAFQVALQPQWWCVPGQGLALPVLPMVLPPAIQALMQSAPNSTPEQQAHQAAAAAAAAAAVMSSPYSAMMLPPSILPIGAPLLLPQDYNADTFRVWVYIAAPACWFIVP